MNEIMKRPVRMPTIIKIDIPVDLAYELRKLLEEYAKENETMDGALAKHISHKLWILLYQSKFSTAPTFTCLTGHWHLFCQRFVQAKLKEEPRDQDLQKILACISAGREVRSA
jgi:hypothetical protein